MKRENNWIIREEFSKVHDFLRENYLIIIEELCEIDYAINYNVKRAQEKGELLLYYGKKGFKFVKKKGSLNIETLNIIKQVFENREGLIKNSTEEHRDLRKLQYLYDVLKRYRNYNLDFMDLLLEIKNLTNNKDLPDNLRYDFNALENLIKEIDGGLLDE